MAKKSKLEERMGSDEFNRLAAKGMQDPTSNNQYSAKEVMAEFRGRGDLKVDEGEGNIKQRFLDAQAGGAKFNARAQKYLTEQHGFDFSKKAKDPVADTVADPVEEKTPVTPESQEKAQVFKDNRMEMVKNFMKQEPSVFDDNRNPSGSVSQISSFDRMFGNNENTVGDGNVFNGNFNQGNIDYSLNLSNQRGY
tara:strand:+ start:53 stop:634 length:582 start_codon:yes stop_codon:yes gene_type:complete